MYMYVYAYTLTHTHTQHTNGGGGSHSKNTHLDEINKRGMPALKSPSVRGLQLRVCQAINY
jgi:hypothetical protein